MLHFLEIDVIAENTIKSGKNENIYCVDHLFTVFVIIGHRYQMSSGLIKHGIKYDE